MLIYNDNWTLASLFDADGNVVQMNTLVGGGETALEVEEIPQEVTSGDYMSGDTANLMIASTEYDGLELLRDWKFRKVPLRAVCVATGRDGSNLIWPEWTRLSEITNNPKANRSEGDGFMKCAFRAHDMAFRRVQNLLAGHSSTSLVFPVAGKIATLSAEDSDEFDLTLEARNFSGSVLADVTDSFEDERGAVELQLPAGTWSLSWSLGGAGDAALTMNRTKEYMAG